MPLSAVIDGETAVGPLVADNEWELLRRRVRANEATPPHLSPVGPPGTLRHLGQRLILRA
jgi:hypothetical protein